MVDVQVELRTWITQFATGDHDMANLLCERHADDPRRLALATRTRKDRRSSSPTANSRTCRPALRAGWRRLAWAAVIASQRSCRNVLSS